MKNKNKKIVSSEIIKEIKNKLDNADWCFSSGNETDSMKACNYLSTQKFSLKYLFKYFEHTADFDVITDLIEDGYSFLDAFVKESFRRIAEDRCSKFAWSGKYHTRGWDLETTCFEMAF